MAVTDEQYAKAKESFDYIKSLLAEQNYDADSMETVDDTASKILYILAPQGQKDTVYVLPAERYNGIQGITAIPATSLVDEYLFNDEIETPSIDLVEQLTWGWEHCFVQRIGVVYSHLNVFPLNIDNTRDLRRAKLACLMLVCGLFVKPDEQDSDYVFSSFGEDRYRVVSPPEEFMSLSSSQLSDWGRRIRDSI